MIKQLLLLWKIKEIHQSAMHLWKRITIH